MLNLIGPSNDNFAILASPSANGTYNVVVYPGIGEADREIAIPAAQLKKFIRDHAEHAEINGPSQASDVFIYSLTEEEVCALMAAGKNLPQRGSASHAA